MRTRREFLRELLATTAIVTVKSLSLENGVSVFVDVDPVTSNVIRKPWDLEYVLSLVEKYNGWGYQQPAPGLYGYSTRLSYSGFLQAQVADRRWPWA